MQPGWVEFQVAAKPLTGWRLWLAIAAGIVLLALVAAVAFAAFVVLVPVVLGLVAWQRWKWRRAFRRAKADADIVDAEYVVIERPKLPDRG